MQSVAQEIEWGGFNVLCGETWEAEGEWEGGMPFKQVVSYTFDLKAKVVIANVQGFTDQEQTEFGKRNHGIRRFNEQLGKFEFYEFDVFGGLTSGEVILVGNDIIYDYQYGDVHLQDIWEYKNDSTFHFKVVEIKNDTVYKSYLHTIFHRMNIDKQIPEGFTQMMVGNWRSKAWNGELFETWKMEDGVLSNSAKYIEGGEVFYEANNFIDNQAGEIILTTVIKGSNPKIFKAVVINDCEIVFENTDYSNPQKVTYKITEKGFEREIEGMENGAPSKYTFVFTKNE